MALAASAAARGEIFPVLFTPSVSRMTTFDFAGGHAQAVDAGCDRRTDGRAVVDGSDADALEVLLQPIVIERDRTDQEGHTGERNEADAIVGPLFDELRDHGFDHFDAIDSLLVNR